MRSFTNKLSNWLFVKAAKAERIIDSSGAGDWMTAVFLYRFLQAHPYYVNQLDDEDIYTMLDSAKQVAAFSCGYLGAQGLFKEDQALQQLEEFFGLKLSFSHIPSFTFSGNCQYCKM